MSGLLMSGILATYGSLCLGRWSNGISVYMKGAGRLISLLIGPAVAALGFKVSVQAVFLLISDLLS